MPQPGPKTPMCQVIITLTNDLSVMTNVQGNANRPLFNLMFETAKQDLLGNLLKAEQQSAVQAAPPELVGVFGGK